MSSRIQLQSSSYYLEALKQHRRTVALIVAFIVTVPLFMFTSLPPIEVIEEIVEEVEELIEVPVVINQTVEVEVNITEGGSIFLESQPAPPLIDSDIVLCIDVSGSMDVNRMPVAKSAIKSFLDLLNKSNSADISNDRVGLVTFHWVNDGDWTTDADNLTTLDFITNQTHLNNIISEVNSLSGSGGTDIWAGLNASLEILLNSPRNEPSLKSIFLLTDGLHQSGPWYDEVYNNKDYNGFMTQPTNVSQDPPYAESPIVVARKNGIKIYSIGLFEGVAFGFDQNFLLNISTNVTHGTFGEFFAGNNTLDLSEGFLKSRDSASGWLMVNSSDILVTDNLTQNLFSFNVTNDIRRLKWDLNWNNSEIDFNLTVMDPNGLIRSITNLMMSEDIIPVTLDIPKSVIFDFPALGEWKFNITCKNSSISEQIKSRLSSFQPPIFIESITQENSTKQNIVFQPQITSDPPESSFSFKIFGLSENGGVNNQSVIFLLNVSNKNPIYNYTNITPYVLANFTSYNITSVWNPANISLLTTGSHTVFQFNLTFNEPTFLQGTIFFKVNCSEGYYDAVAQGVSLDFRINTVSINQTISTISLSQGTTVVMKYTYNRQDFDTLKWTGFFVTLGLLMSFLGVYVTAQAYHLRSITNKVRNRLFPDRSIINLALQEKGISMSPDDLNAVIDSTTDLDQFAENIFNLTGQRLSPEDLLSISSGATLEQIIQRLSRATSLSPEAVASQLKDASSVEELMVDLNLDRDLFLDIIAKDEQVTNFQARIATFIQPIRREMSSIISNDEIDVIRFRERMKKEIG